MTNEQKNQLAIQYDLMLDLKNFLGVNFGYNLFYSDGQKEHRRYFRIAGITVCVESEVDLESVKFVGKLMSFAVDDLGDDNVTIRHYFELPNISGKDFGKEIYHQPPWVISNKDGIWCYKGILPAHKGNELHRLAFFNSDYTSGIICSPSRYKDLIRTHGWQSLSFFPTDQVWLGPLLADRNAIMIHSAAAILNGHGLVFVGHSDAGKSTTMELLKVANKIDRSMSEQKDRKGTFVEILCDDRNIVRKWSESWRVHGTWSHGDVTDVSPSSAPLRAILFLEQAKENEIVHLTDRKLIWRRLLATLIRAAVTTEWWQKELDILEQLVTDIEFYRMRFDKSGAIIPILERLTK